MKGRRLYRTSLWQMVFGPAGLLCMGSKKNYPGHEPGLAHGFLTGHRAVASQKSENFMDAATAFGQGARQAKRHSVIYGPSARGQWRLTAEPSTASRAGKKYPHREVAAFCVVPGGGAGLQGSPAADWTGAAS